MKTTLLRFLKKLTLTATPKPTVKSTPLPLPLRQTSEWRSLFRELCRLQNSGKHDFQDIVTITGFFTTLEELEAHVKANS